mgnify:CR=1 FL=1
MARKSRRPSRSRRSGCKKGRVRSGPRKGLCRKRVVHRRKHSHSRRRRHSRRRSRSRRHCAHGHKKGSRTCKRKPGPKSRRRSRSGKRRCSRGRIKGGSRCRKKPGRKRASRSVARLTAGMSPTARAMQLAKSPTGRRAAAGLGLAGAAAAAARLRSMSPTQRAAMRARMRQGFRQRGGM